MGSDFRDILPPEPGMQITWYGVVAKDCTDFTHRIPVILPDWDETLEWGPCRWQSRDDVNLPHKGDSCLIVFDSNRDPWIVAWWPFST